MYYDSETGGSYGLGAGFGGTRPYGSSNHGSGSYTISPGEMLEPLIQRMQQYDTLRLRLEQAGGHASDFQGIADILNAPIILEGFYDQNEVRLTDPKNLSYVLREMSYDIHLDVRQLHTRMPVYYLCRIQRDYWGTYSLIVEDYYMSPGYPLQDERFIHFMSVGHERFHLRLSQFREGAEAIVGEDEKRRMSRIDDLLYSLGREIFNAMWHEDQRLGMAVAKHFDLPLFRSAVETIYVCLSSDLCRVRAAAGPDIMAFFHEDGSYPQPFLGRFLTFLSEADGTTLNELPQRALRVYKNLLHAFRSFLSTEVAWGFEHKKTLLWKLVFGNYFRLDVVSTLLHSRGHLEPAREKLEALSQDMMNELMKDKSRFKRSVEKLLGA